MSKTKRIISILMIGIFTCCLICGCGKNTTGTIEVYTGGAADEIAQTQVQAEEAGTEAAGQSGEVEQAAEAVQEETQAQQEASAGSIANEKPIVLYLMNYDTKTCEQHATFSAVWDENEPIGVFGAFNTDQAEFTFEDEIEAHKQYWDAVNTATAYKIGYELSFDVNGEHKVITLLSPQDIEDSADLFGGDVSSETVTGYMGVWLYDDYNQEGGWYSHVTADEYNDSTLLTSIKLQATPNSGAISNLKLKGFSYSSSLEFDSNGHYNGAYGYEMSIGKE